MNNPINERNTQEFFKRLEAEQPPPDHESQFEITSLTTASGKAVHRCVICEFETPFPTRTCLWSKEAREKRNREIALHFGGNCGDAK